jgi:two-component system phosphate regulon sensor histidine kinase PhoR
MTGNAADDPLSALIVTLRQLTSGDNAARAAVTGPAEVQEAARLLNALADEHGQQQRQAQEYARLRAVAREAGNRIRASLSAQEVIREAVATIEQSLDSDIAYMHLVEDGKVGPPVGHDHNWAFPDDFLSGLDDLTLSGLLEYFKGLLWNGTSLVFKDIRGEERRLIPRPIRESMLRVGVVSHITTPFGAGQELSGFVSAHRLRPGCPWTAAEIDAFESIAADIGRGLHHARLYEAENRLVEDLKALDRARTDFLATVSHDLSTPLTSIAGYVELLEDEEAGPLTAHQKEMLTTIRRNAALLQSLIEDILMMSKIELGVAPRKRAPVDLAAAVPAIVRAIRPVAEAGQVTVVAECCEHSLIVDGDTSQLDRVLMNLLSNGVKFTPTGGTVTVTTARDDPWVMIRVADTGIGIPEQDLKNLFNRFFRASNAVERSVPGTGLGLSLSRAIIVDHGGEMDVESQEGIGTTMTIRLPQAGTSPHSLTRRLTPISTSYAGSGWCPRRSW